MTNVIKFEDPRKKYKKVIGHKNLWSRILCFFGVHETRGYPLWLEANPFKRNYYCQQCGKENY